MAGVYPIRGQQVVLHLGPRSLMCSLKIPKRQSGAFFIVNMHLVKASAFISRSKTLLLSKGKESLPCFVDHLQVRHAEVCQGSLLPALLYNWPRKAGDRVGAILLLPEQGKGQLFSSCVAMKRLVCWLLSTADLCLDSGVLYQEPCDGSRQRSHHLTVGKLRHSHASLCVMLCISMS